MMNRQQQQQHGLEDDDNKHRSTVANNVKIMSFPSQGLKGKPQN